MTPQWRLAAESQGDDDTIINLSAQMDLPTLDVDLSGADGFMSPARARAIGSALIDAADYAEQCIRVGAGDRPRGDDSGLAQLHAELVDLDLKVAERAHQGSRSALEKLDQLVGRGIRAVEEIERLLSEVAVEARRYRRHHLQLSDLDLPVATGGLAHDDSSSVGDNAGRKAGEVGTSEPTEEGPAAGQAWRRSDEGDRR